MDGIVPANVPVLVILADERAAPRLTKLLDDFSKLMLRDHLILVQRDIRQGSTEIWIIFVNVDVWVSIPVALAVGSGLEWLIKKIRRRSGVRVGGKSDQAAYSQAVLHLKERVHAPEPYRLITQDPVGNAGFHFEFRDHSGSVHPYYVAVSCRVTYGSAVAATIKAMA